MDTERMCEVVKAYLTDSLCEGCSKYGKGPLNLSCDKCAELTSYYVIKILKGEED